MLFARLFILLIGLSLAGCTSVSRGPGTVRTTSIHVNRQAKPKPPKLKRQSNGRYRVQRKWLVALNGKRWKVQKGYSSNGITAPSKLKRALGDGVDKPETWAAVFHDWLFTQPGLSRTTADKLFHDLLIAYGVNPDKARLMHTTVSAYSLSKAFR